MAKKNDNRPGYGKLLDAWVSPESAGDSIGCIATTFTFSPLFFEEECLGRFLGIDSDPDEDWPVYLVEREEKLAQLRCAAVVVDQHNCRGKRSLRWDLMCARVPKGVLHAKVSLLQWTGHVRLIVASANLTEDGYRRNQEVFGILDYYPGSEAPLVCLQQTVRFLRDIVGLSNPGGEAASPAAGRANAFVTAAARTAAGWGADVGRRTSVRIAPVFTGQGRPSVLAALRGIWPGGSPAEDATVVSPFFDPPGTENRPARELWGILKQRGKAGVSYYVSAEDIPGEKALLVHAPRSLQDAEPRGRADVCTDFYRVELGTARPLHAKSIRLDDPRWALCMIGSSNFTSKGLGIAASANVEANLAYTVDKRRDNGAYGRMKATFLAGSHVDVEGEVRWQPVLDEDDEQVSDSVTLPAAFGAAVYDWGPDTGGTIRLQFIGRPPVGWALTPEDSTEPCFCEADWIHRGSPSELVLSWPAERPLSGFLVRWQACLGPAWWPVNVASVNSLPPVDTLRDLPLDVLLYILSSARPLHKLISEYLKRRKREGEAKVATPEVDPLRRIDTSQFILQRTRRVSVALCALRERLERPVPTRECLDWRLRGPIGVMALASALAREAKSEEEKAFLVSELALELTRVRPQSCPGCVLSSDVRREIQAVAGRLKDMVDWNRISQVQNLRDYVRDVFDMVEA